jgi:hypothetical protein
VQSEASWAAWETGKRTCKRVPSVRSQSRRISSTGVVKTAGAGPGNGGEDNDTKTGGEGGWALTASCRWERKAPALQCNSRHNWEAE